MQRHPIDDRSHRTPTVAIAAAAIGMLLPVVAVVLASLDGRSAWDLVVAHDLIGISTGFLSAVVGLLIVRRHHRHRLGWLLVGVAVALGVYGASRQFALLAPPSVPGWQIAAWFALWTNLPCIMVAGGLQYFLFPDGRLPSASWRWCFVPAAAATVVIGVAQAAATWPFRSDPRALQVLPATADRIFMVGFTLGMVFYVVGVAALVARYRAADAGTRQQIAWVLWALLVAVPMQLVALAGTVGAVLELLTVPLTFGAIAIGILRYRLFDIDRLVSRTVVYALLTAFVVGVYVLGVLVVGQAVSGGRRPSPIIVAATTLVIAAAFQPAHRRIQDGVDRRFHRRRYDAVRTIEAFAAHLRDDADVEQLLSQIGAVLDVTMQPADASLWLTPVRRR